MKKAYLVLGVDTYAADCFSGDQLGYQFTGLHKYLKKDK
jgi:hypothetical protein